MPDQPLEGELLLRIDEVKYVVERWRTDYNRCRPHCSLNYMALAGFAELYREAGRVRS